jgi:hypothetical protein
VQEKGKDQMECMDEKKETESQRRQTEVEQWISNDDAISEMPLGELSLFANTQKMGKTCK